MGFSDAMARVGHSSWIGRHAYDQQFIASQSQTGGLKHYSYVMLDIIGVQLLDDTLHDGFGSKCSTEKNRMDFMYLHKS